MPLKRSYEKSDCFEMLVAKFISIQKIKQGSLVECWGLEFFIRILSLKLSLISVSISVYEDRSLCLLCYKQLN